MSSSQSSSNPKSGSYPSYHRQLGLDETRSRRRAQRSQNRYNPQPPTGADKSIGAVNHDTEHTPVKTRQLRSVSSSSRAPSTGDTTFAVPHPIPTSPIHRTVRAPIVHTDGTQRCAGEPSPRDGSSGVPLPSPGKSISSFGSNLEDDKELLRKANVSFAPQRQGDRSNAPIPKASSSKKPKPSQPGNVHTEVSQGHPLPPGHNPAPALGPGYGTATSVGAVSDDGLSILATAGAKSGLGDESRRESSEQVGDDGSRAGSHDTGGIPFETEREDTEPTGLNQYSSGQPRPISPFPDDEVPPTPARHTSQSNVHYEGESSPSFGNSPHSLSHRAPLQAPLSQKVRAVPGHDPQLASGSGFGNEYQKSGPSPSWLPSQSGDHQGSAPSVTVKSPLQRLEKSLKEGGQPIEGRNEGRKKGYRRYVSGSKGNESDVRLGRRVPAEQDQKGDREYGSEAFGEEFDSATPSATGSAWSDIRRRVVNANANNYDKCESVSPAITDTPGGKESPVFATSVPSHNHGWGNARHHSYSNQHNIHPLHHQTAQVHNNVLSQARASPQEQVQNSEFSRGVAPPLSPRTKILTHPFVTSVAGAPAGSSSQTKKAPRASPPQPPQMSPSRRIDDRKNHTPGLSLSSPADARFAEERLPVGTNSHLLPTRKRLPLELLHDDTDEIPKSEYAAPSWVNKQGIGYWAHEKVPGIRVSGGYSKASSISSNFQHNALPPIRSPPLIFSGQREIGGTHLLETSTPSLFKTEQPGLFVPPLYLKCGPLLRFCGTQRTKEGKDIWRGSILIVTLDGKSVYSSGPTVRVFTPAPNTQHRKHHRDAIAGTIKPSRIGKTLYVRPSRDLIPGANLSAVENDGGLFQESPFPSTDGLEDENQSWKSALAADKSGAYSDIQGTRLLSDKHTTFWRFDLRFTLKETAQRVGYRVNGGPPLFFHIPAKGRGMRVAVHSRNGVAETEKDRLGDGKHGEFDPGADMKLDLSVLGGPDPMWRDMLNSHMAEPYHAMVGAGGQVVLDSAIKETVWFGDWWRKKLAANHGNQSDVNMNEVNLGLASEIKRPGSRSSERSLSRSIPLQSATPLSMQPKAPPAPPSSPNTGVDMAHEIKSGFKISSKLHDAAAAQAPQPHSSMPPDMRAELELFFTLKYSAAFSHGLMSLAGSMIPSVNVWSEDGEGFRAFDRLDQEGLELRSDPVAIEAWRIALKYYLLFQHHTLLEAGTSSHTDPTLDQTWISPPYISSLTRLPSKSFFMNMGAPMALLALDACSDRDSSHIIRRETYETIAAKLNTEIVKGQTRHLLVCVGGPMVFPRRKKFLDDRKGFSNKKVSVTKTIANFFSDRDKQKQNNLHLGSAPDLTCLSATWTDPVYTSERRNLIHMLQQLAREKSVRVTLISCSSSAGVAAVGQFLSREPPSYMNSGAKNIPKHYDFRYMPSIIAPSTSALPVGPNALSDLEIGPQDLYRQQSLQTKIDSGIKPFPTRRLSQSSKQNPRMLQFLQSAVYPLDGATDESMIPLFGDGTISLDWRDDFREHNPHGSGSEPMPYFMHRRGWCSIAEFTPDDSPPPSGYSGEGSDGYDLSSQATILDGSSEPLGRTTSKTMKRLGRLFSTRRKSSSEGGQKIAHSALGLSSTESWKTQDGVKSTAEPEGRSHTRRMSLKRGASGTPSARGGAGNAPPRSFFNQFGCIGARDGCAPGVGNMAPLSFDGGSRPPSAYGSSRGLNDTVGLGLPQDSPECLPCRTSVGSRKDAGLSGAPQVSTIPVGVAERSGYASTRHSLDASARANEPSPQHPNPFKRRATIVGSPVDERRSEGDRSAHGRSTSLTRTITNPGTGGGEGKPQRRGTISRLLRRGATKDPRPRGADLQSPTSAGFSVDDLAKQVEERVRLGLESAHEDKRIAGAESNEDDGMVDLKHGLDIRFCIERDSGMPEGYTKVYRLLVPSLWVNEEQMRWSFAQPTAAGVGVGRKSADSNSRAETQHYPRPVGQSPAYTTYPPSPTRPAAFVAPKPLGERLQGSNGISKSKNGSGTTAASAYPSSSRPAAIHYPSFPPQTRSANLAREDSPQKELSGCDDGVDSDDGADHDNDNRWLGRSHSYQIRRYPSYPKF